MEAKLTDMVLTPISWRELEDADLLLLTRLCRAGYANTGPMDIIEAAARGQFALLRYLHAGLFIIEAITHLGGDKELVIWGMIGKGILANKHKIFDELCYYAKLNNCKFIGGRSLHKGLNRVYERLLQTPAHATYFVKEI